MLRAHTQFFKARFDAAAELLFTDTDSLCYKITRPCITTEMLSSVAIVFDLKEALSPQDIQRHCQGDPHKIALLLNNLRDDKGKLGAMKLENRTDFIKE